jgi:hypothetical protein
MSIADKRTSATLKGFERAILTNEETGGIDVYFNITTSFSRSWQSSITEHAVEEGAPITDNIYNSPPEYSMSIIMIDEEIPAKENNSMTRMTVAERESQILKWRDEKEILILIYKDAFHNVVIKDFSESKQQMTNGSTYSISFKEIRIATAEVQAGAVSDKGKTELREDSN